MATRSKRARIGIQNLGERAKKRKKVYKAETKENVSIIRQTGNLKLDSLLPGADRASRDTYYMVRTCKESP